MRLCSYARKCRSGKIRILAYFTQCVTIFSIAAVECFTGTSTFLNSIQDGGEGGGGGEGKKLPLTSFSPVTSTNVGITGKKFLTF